jgi:thiol-disulfide isomerase/thioredoxin
MKPSVVAVLVLAVSSALVLGCGTETKYVFPDGGVQDDAAAQADARQCGPDYYPCGPYGTSAPAVIENLTFAGWVDTETDHLAYQNNPYQNFGLDWFYQQGRTAGAKYLFLNVSAGWCVWCKTENGLLPGYANSYRDKGILFFEVLFQDADGNPAGRDFVQGWAGTYHLPFTVAVDAPFKMGNYFDSAGTPANIAISLQDQTLNGAPVKAMEIIQISTGYDQSGYEGMLDALLVP